MPNFTILGVSYSPLVLKMAKTSPAQLRLAQISSECILILIRTGTSSAWLRSAQRSSVPKFDSDLFCLEKLISWDWLREAELLNSIITKTCFTQKKFYPNFGSLFWFWRYKEYPCPLNPHLGLWFGILILIWIWSLIFDTPIIQILALYLDF